MTVKDFLSRLEQLLADLPPDERSAALEYYTEYLQDACLPQDADACALLGTPEAVAADIRLTRVAEGDAGWAAGYRGNDGSASYGQCLGEEPAAPQAPMMDAEAPAPASAAAGAQPAYRGAAAAGAAKRGGSWLPWLLLALVTCPLWIGLAGGVLGVLGSLLGLIITVVVAAAALVIGGFVVLVVAAPLLATAFGSGLLTMGIALLAAAAGCVLLGLLIWLAGTALPFVFGILGKMFRWLKGRLKA